MRSKLGLFSVDEKDKLLILDLLTLMHQKKMDYTNTFCHLMNAESQIDKNYEDKDVKKWKKSWKERLKSENNSSEKYIKMMKTVNPLVIPRNNKVEEALEAAENENLNPINQLLEILSKPYTFQEDIADYRLASSKNDENYQTFCGT